jgi:3-oxoacyl-[acyl-carrier-protein] synthase II
MALRRVVVTGLGCVSPLGIGAHHVWTRLLAGDVGIKSIQDMGDDLPSKVAGVVPAGYKEGGGFDALEWMSADDVRRSALFTQYARCAAEQALQDAGWRPTTQHERHHTVSLV